MCKKCQDWSINSNWKSITYWKIIWLDNNISNCHIQIFVTINYLDICIHNTYLPSYFKNKIPDCHFRYVLHWCPKLELFLSQSTFNYWTSIWNFSLLMKYYWMSKVKFSACATWIEKKLRIAEKNPIFPIENFNKRKSKSYLFCMKPLLIL